MPEAYIYDHVRTPRGRGKADGALHEVTALALATAPLKALKERNNIAARCHRRCRARRGRSGRRGRLRHRALRGDRGRARRSRSRRADQPLLRFRPRCGEFRRRPDHERPARTHHRRRRRIDEPGRHRRLRRRLADGPLDRGAGLFHAAGRLRRSDRDQIRLFARRRRRLCGAEPAARREGVGRGPLQEFGGPGQGRQRAHHPRQGRAHAAHHDDAVARPVAAVIRGDGPDGRLRRGGDPVASGNRARQLRASCRQFVRDRRRRRRGTARQQGSRRQTRPEAAGQNPRLRQYRLGAGDDADRPGRRHRKAVRALGHEEIGHRSVRIERGVRLGGAALHPGLRHRQRQDQRQWRRDRARPSARRHRRDDFGYRARRTRAHQQIDRAGHAVHRRWHGHRDDHREESNILLPPPWGEGRGGG